MHRHHPGVAGSPPHGRAGPQTQTGPVSHLSLSFPDGYQRLHSVEVQVI